MSVRFLEVGDALPDLQVPSLDGEQVNLRQFLGRKLLLFMWASW